MARKTRSLTNKHFGLSRAAPLWSNTMTIVKEGCFSMFLYPFLHIFFCHLISCIGGQKTKGQAWFRGSKLPTTRNVCPKECFEAPPADTGRFLSLPNSLLSLHGVQESMCKLHETWDTNCNTKLGKNCPPFSSPSWFYLIPYFSDLYLTRSPSLSSLSAYAQKKPLIYYIYIITIIYVNICC